MIFLFSTSQAFETREFFDQKLANSYLRSSTKTAETRVRAKRDNTGYFEEKTPPSFERECIEENCSPEEIKETSFSDILSQNIGEKNRKPPKSGQIMIERIYLKEKTDPTTSPGINYAPNSEKIDKESSKILFRQRYNQIYDVCNSAKPQPCDSRLARKCISIAKDYRCVCRYQWSGRNCDKCGKQDCNIQNTRRCIRTRMYGKVLKCQCKKGWTGKSCDIKRDFDQEKILKCKGFICAEDRSTGRCSSNGGCECKRNWGGDKCTIKWKSVGCSPEHKCILENSVGCKNGYCQCKKCFDGVRCRNEVKNCVDPELGKNVTVFDDYSNYQGGESVTEPSVADHHRNGPTAWLAIIEIFGGFCLCLTVATFCCRKVHK